MEQNYKVGNFITYLRKEKKLTQSKLGELVGVSNKAISKWENGQGFPDTKYITKLCEVLDISLDELLAGKRSSESDNPVLTNISRLEHVYKYYDNDSRIEIGLKDVNLTFQLGEIVAVVGASGSGKTTLINMIGGIDIFEDGEIYINNEGISRYDQMDYENYRKKYISYIFQDYGILESYSILDNLCIVQILMGKSYKEAKQCAIEILKKIDLYPFRHKNASKLSGGQKQKLSIARAILKDTPIVLGDEITANLDSKSAKEIINLLIEYSKNKLLILVTHHYEEIASYVTRKITLSDGCIVEDKQIKESESIPYEAKEEKIPSSIFLGTMLFLKQWKYSSFRWIIAFFSFIFCVGLLLLIVCIGDSNLGTGSILYDSMEVIQNNDQEFTVEDIKKVEDLNGISQVNAYEWDTAYFNFIRIYDSFLKVEQAEISGFQVSDTIPFGEAVIFGPFEIQDCALAMNSYFILFDKIEFVQQAKSTFTICVSKDMLDLLKKIVICSPYISYSYQTEERDIRSSLYNYAINFTKNFTDTIYLPKDSSILTEISSGDSITLTSLGDKNVTVLETSYPFSMLYYVAYSSLFEDLVLTTKHLMVKLDFEQEQEIRLALSQMGYSCFSRMDLKQKIGGPQVFFTNLVVFLILIVAFIVLYALLKISYIKILRMRKKEYNLLKKLGFTNRSIYWNMILPILCSITLFWIGLGIGSIFIHLNAWYYILALYGIPVWMGFLICKNIYHRQETVWKEEKKNA